MTPAAVIAVPARNEAERLPRLLRALAGQAGAPPFALCLLLDGCTDASRAAAERLRAQLPFPLFVHADGGDLPPNAGRARAAVAALALAHAPGAMLVTTDADGEPAPGWLAASLAGLARAEIVAGRIEPDQARPIPVQRRLIRYLDGLHALRRLLDPVEWEAHATHHWTSAASLAIRPEVYRALGGFAARPSGEDADLADRAWRAGYRVRRDGGAIVHTSTRAIGRTPDGFAASLAGMEAAAAPPTVAHPADEAWRYRQHALARALFDGDAAVALGRGLGVRPEEVARVAAASPNADAFAARIVGAPPEGMRAVPLPVAEAALAALLAQPLEVAA